MNDSGGKLFNSLSNLPASNRTQSPNSNSTTAISKKFGTSSHDLSENVHLLFSLFRSSKPQDPFLTLRAYNAAERLVWMAVFDLLFRRKQRFDREVMFRYEIAVELFNRTPRLCNQRIKRGTEDHTSLKVEKKTVCRFPVSSTFPFVIPYPCNLFSRSVNSFYRTYSKTCHLDSFCSQATN